LKDEDAAIVSIALIDRSLIRDHVTVVVNDGAARLLHKDKAYSLLASQVPMLAADITALMRDSKSFIVDISDAKIICLTVDERAKMEETIEKIRKTMNITSADVIDEAKEQQLIIKGVGRDLYGAAKEFKKQDDIIMRASKIDGYDPMKRTKDNDRIRRKKA